MAVHDREELRKTLKNLIVDKKNGKLDTPEKFDNQDKKWRGVIDYEILWSCVKHYCPEVRRDVLELLVVSKKSTQRFIKIEYELIELFLKYNLGERIELVPLIKKAIKRTRDSLVVLQREYLKTEKIQNFQGNNVCHIDQSKHAENDAQNIALRHELKRLIDDYESFLVSLRKICIHNLYPTANYERRRSSLQILCHMEDILDAETIELEWNKSQARVLFDCLLLDTYETNKDMVYKILKSIPPTLLELDNQNTISEIIQTAIGLANSIRPIDSATAAYMFKVCLASPIVVKNVVHQRPEFDKLSTDNDDVHLTLVILLIAQLQKPLEIAKENIVKAASRHSLYGYLFCIRNLIINRNLDKCPGHERWRKAIADLVEMCFDLNNAAGQIVNNSSPEGHLPMDLNPCNLSSSLFDSDLMEFEKVTTPQMVLLCAWRTVKEVSLLFGYLTAKLPIDEPNETAGLLTEKQVINIGEHFVTLLSETKHRGAFEQAHVGFGQLCGRLWHQPEGRALKDLPKIWLLELLLAVTGLSPRDSKLCATRRSAGVPFMVQALLTSEESLTAVIKSGGSFTFHSTMRILLGLTSLNDDDDDLDTRLISLIYKDTAFTQFKSLSCAANTDNSKIINNTNEKTKCSRVAEIKTHVINILRALFRHCQLGECVKPYIADGVICAIKSYNGKTWAERNAATLLFSAMVVRIFGVQRTKDHLNLSVHNRMTGKVFFQKYPTLLDFMYTELEEFVKPGDTLIRPGVQSVLLLLSRLYPGSHNTADSNWKVAEFLSMVSKCAKSQVYETRELAARALVPLLTEATAHLTFSKILETISMEFQNYSNINMIHGYILQVLQISKSPEFATFEPSATQIKDFVKNTLWILEKLESRKRGVGISFPLATTYLETLLQIYRVNSEWVAKCVQDEGIDLFYRVRLHLVENKVLSNSPGREIYEVAAAKFFTFWCISCNIGQYDLSGSNESVKDKCLKNRWTPLFHHDNIDVRLVAWGKSTELVGSNINPIFSRVQLKEAIIEGRREIGDSLHDPNLEEAVFNFFYTILTDTENCNPLRTEPKAFEGLLENLFRHLSEKLYDQEYYVRDCFLRFLGAVYGDMSKKSTVYNFLSSDDKETIYELFFKNSWMDTCSNDCRLAVAQTISNLYQPMAENNDCFVIYWWTILLNLLVDDDKAVRNYAAGVVCKLKTETPLVCDVGIRKQFFEKFLNLVAKERPDVAMAALFSWGVATWREEDYEMDDTDVFNKCRNYDSFEQLEISNLCLTSLKEIGITYPLNTRLQSRTIQWLQKLYDCEFAFETLYEFVNIHKECIPTLGNKLDDYLDPTYSDKLQQVLAFKQFTNLLSNQCSNPVALA